MEYWWEAGWAVDLGGGSLVGVWVGGSSVGGKEDDEGKEVGL